MLGRNRAENHWLQAVSTSEQRKHMWKQILAEVREIFTVWHAAKCQLPSPSSAQCYQHGSRVSSSVLWVPIFLFMTLSADALVALWDQALACWLWRQSCITYKRTAWHSSVFIPRNISQCTSLPGCAGVKFHPHCAEGRINTFSAEKHIFLFTIRYKLPAEGREDLDQGTPLMQTYFNSSFLSQEWYLLVF